MLHAEPAATLPKPNISEYTYKVYKLNPINYIHMISVSQKSKNNGYVASGRIDCPTYHSMIGLLSAAEYTDVSSFVNVQY